MAATDRELGKAIDLANDAVDSWLELMNECDINLDNPAKRKTLIRIICEACAESFARPFNQDAITMERVLEEIEKINSRSLYQPPAAYPAYQVTQPQYVLSTAPASTGNLSHNHTFAATENTSAGTGLVVSDNNTISFSSEFMTKDAVEKMLREKFDPPTS